MYTFGPFAINQTSKLKKLTNLSTTNETPIPQERIAVLQVGELGDAPFPFYRTNSNNLQAYKCDVIMLELE